MNWDLVWTDGIVPAIEADPDVQDVLGGAIYLDGVREIEVPSMTALYITDTEEETFAPVDWQFDIYTAALDDALRVERALRRLFHRSTQYWLGPFFLFSEFVDGRELNGPAEDPFYRRSIDFQFRPVRSRYHRTAVAES